MKLSGPAHLQVDKRERREKWDRHSLSTKKRILDESPEEGEVRTPLKRLSATCSSDYDMDLEEKPISRKKYERPQPAPEKVAEAEREKPCLQKAEERTAFGGEAAAAQPPLPTERVPEKEPVEDQERVKLAADLEGFDKKIQARQPLVLSMSSPRLLSLSRPHACQAARLLSENFLLCRSALCFPKPYSSELSGKAWEKLRKRFSQLNAPFHEHTSIAVSLRFSPHRSA